MKRQDFAKCWAYDCIIEHLQKAKKDSRHRERIRAGIACRHIAEWYNEGLDAYDSNEKSR